TLWQSWRDRGLVRWRPDIYIYCGAVPSSRTATRLKELGALLVQYMGISPQPLSPDDPLRRGLASADVAVCNSDQIEQEAEELGCRHTHFVWAAYEDSHFQKLDAMPWNERPYDVGFVGEIGSAHGARRAFLAEVFERCSDLRLSLY